MYDIIMNMMAIQEQNNFNRSVIESDKRRKEELREQEQKENRFNYLSECGLFGVMDNINRESEFRIGLKRDLLSEALNIVFDKMVYFPLYEKTDVLKTHLVSSYVNEHNVENLLEAFSTRSYLLSEITRIVLETADIISEKADVNEKNKIIDPTDKDEFYKKISNIEDLDYAQASVKTKVSMAINQFNAANLEKKKQIENIMNISQAKLNNNLSEEINKFNEQRAYEEQYEIRNGRKGVLEYMVLNTMESAIKNEQIKANFISENGDLDMDKIVDHCSIMYSFLEMLNTLKMEDITPEYIKEQVYNLKTK